jgi:hypothetical protein
VALVPFLSHRAVGNAIAALFPALRSWRRRLGTVAEPMVSARFVLSFAD